MADLTNREKRDLENLLAMGNGYVLDFSDARFNDFVSTSVGKDISQPQYCSAGGSKAKRLRAFWNTEPNHVVGRLLKDLVGHAESKAHADDGPLIRGCRETVRRLLSGTPVPDLDALLGNGSESAFDSLARAVRASIEANEPETGLDRLHTYTVKFLRFVVRQRGISTERDKPLHSLMGEYVKALKQGKLIESEMTERILKTSISVLDAFNEVRNERSLAHDNTVLNPEESLLIVNQVTGVIRFIRSLEAKASKNARASPGVGAAE